MSRDPSARMMVIHPARVLDSSSFSGSEPLLPRREQARCPDWANLLRHRQSSLFIAASWSTTRALEVLVLFLHVGLPLPCRIQEWFLGGFWGREGLITPKEVEMDWEAGREIGRRLKYQWAFARVSGSLRVFWHFSVERGVKRGALER
jgi:hypothetical protein